MRPDGTADYRSLTRAQLAEARANIDADRYPLNLARLTAELEARDAGRVPEPVAAGNRSGTWELFLGLRVCLAGMLVIYGGYCLAHGRLVFLVPVRRWRDVTAVELHGPSVGFGAAAAFIVALAILVGPTPTPGSRSLPWNLPLAVVALVLWAIALLWPHL